MKGGASASQAERPCATCGEPTLNPRLCRDCYIEEAIEGGTCTTCGIFVFNDSAKSLGCVGCQCAVPTFKETI